MSYHYCNLVCYDTVVPLHKGQLEPNHWCDHHSDHPTDPYRKTIYRLTHQEVLDLLSLYNSGLIDTDEARALLGFTPRNTAERA